MSARPLLDADMRTIGQWLLQGWHWWVDELRGLVPLRWRRAQLRGVPRLLVRGRMLQPEPGRRASPVSKAGMRVALVVSPADCLCRVVTRPAVGERDLLRMIAFEADSLLPLPAEAMLIAARIAGPADEQGQLRIEVAGLPIDRARAMLELAATTRLVPVAVIVEEAASRAEPLDFAPALRRAGLLPPQRSAAPWLWALVVLLMGLTIGFAIARDVARVTQLDRIVAEQQPAVSIAQAIARRSEQDRRLVQRTLALRRQREPLRLIAAVHAALPDGAWLQRLAWDGETIRLIGYRPEGADVATALRQSGRFAKVHAMEEDTQAALPTGQPFDLAASVKPR